MDTNDVYLPWLIQRPINTDVQANDFIAISSTTAVCRASIHTAVVGQTDQFDKTFRIVIMAKINGDQGTGRGGTR